MVRFIEKEKGHSPIHGKYAKEEEKKNVDLTPQPPPPPKKKGSSNQSDPKNKISSIYAMRLQFLQMSWHYAPSKCKASNTKE
jgi:hypothetical protein